MKAGRVISCTFAGRVLGVLLLFAFGAAGHAQKRDNKGPKISEKIFRQTSSLLLDDPLSRSARDWSRLILLYTLQTSEAVMVLGPDEMSWAAMDRNDPHSLLLLAAYAGGNIRAQLNSGVKRNDRYSGLLTLFRVYRALREKDAKFRIAEVDNLLKLHADNRLTAHLQKLDEKKQGKMTAVEEEIIRKLMDAR